MTTALTTPTDLDSRRAGLRADVALASRVVPVSRPLDEFVAVNPLGGFEDLPFGEAVATARALFGVRGFLSEHRYRELHRSGRITDDDLTWAASTHAARSGPAAPITTARITAAPPDAAALVEELLTSTVPELELRSHRTVAEVHDAVHDSALAGVVDEQAVRWCAAYLGSTSGWSLPGRERGLYDSWRQLVVDDRSLDRSTRRRLADLPERSDDALLHALDELGVTPTLVRSVLRSELAALPGWAAHLRWRAEHHHDADLVDYLALRLACLAALAEPSFDLGTASLAVDAPAPNRKEPGVLDAADRLEIWQRAHERRYRSTLLEAISTTRPERRPSVEPDAQIVVCIDVRSEGVRRAIEAQGHYETLGFAGFFGVAIAWRPMSGGAQIASCPALVSPRHSVTEIVDGPDRQLRRYLRGLDGRGGALDGVHDAKATPGGAFVFAEAAGWISGPMAAARTISPTSWARATGWVRRRLAPEPATVVDLSTMPLPDRILTARAALTTMGLSRFAPLVVLCGHTSSTAANPYEAALRCGACGGHTGGPNARVLAAVLNDPDVRAAVAEGDQGIAIPSDTIFIAAEHDTTTDTIEILDAESIPDTHVERVARLRGDLEVAARRLAAERCAQLPGAPAHPDPDRAGRHVLRRAEDWSETYPEWGLAGNAAFVVGPRSMTEALDLDRRVFLHSYDPELDPDGLALETILTAPLVVAQWINCQYYFSSTDPEVFGAGTKTVHNAIDTVGVLAGRTGDLRIGLPLQSVAIGDRLLHDPLRLLAVVQAPRSRIGRIIDRNPALRDLVAGEWIGVVARDEAQQPWSTWTPHGWIDHDEGARP